MALFYVPDLTSGNCTLNAEESAHCIRVLRHAAGDVIRLTDGIGSYYEASIVSANPKACVVSQIARTAAPPPPFRLHIAIAPPKNSERFEWFLEKATETGISRITPIICEHSERSRINHERLGRVIVAAMKQSERALLPELSQAIRFQDLIAQADEPYRCIAHCVEEHKELPGKNYLKGTAALVLIGPEGDFSRQEIDQAIQAGFHPITLGNYRLRTETAAMNACTILNYLNE